MSHVLCIRERVLPTSAVIAFIRNGSVAVRFLSDCGSCGGVSKLDLPRDTDPNKLAGPEFTYGCREYPTEFVT